MFDFLGRRKVDRRPSADRRRGRAPVVIGFEQLEGREMLSSGMAVSLIPSGSPPLRSMPRPMVGSFDPESPTAIPAPTFRKPLDEEAGPGPRFGTWPLGGRFRFG
jgi:hypothetical protein